MFARFWTILFVVMSSCLFSCASDEQDLFWSSSDEKGVFGDPDFSDMPTDSRTTSVKAREAFGDPPYYMIDDVTNPGMNPVVTGRLSEGDKTKIYGGTITVIHRRKGVTPALTTGGRIVAIIYKNVRHTNFPVEIKIGDSFAAEFRVSPQTRKAHAFVYVELDDMTANFPDDHWEDKIE